MLAKKQQRSYTAPVVEAIAWVRRLAKSGGARAIREGADISGPELARELGVSPSSLSRWERGLRSPRGDAAKRWAAALRKLT